MSAHCNTCGCDMWYPAGTWPLGECPRCPAIEALKRIAEQQQKTLAMIEANGFVFDSIGNEPGNWQHLAFSIYTDLCEVDSIARGALE